MKKNLKDSLSIIAVLFVLLCIIYPSFIFLFSHTFLHKKAQGSLIEINKNIVGSKLIGQKFDSDYYFHSRPSFHDYNGIDSQASNLSPTNKDLQTITHSLAQNYRKINSLNANIKIPADAISYSASSLDPHISYNNAILQSQRVAKARNIDISTLQSTIEKFTEKGFYDKKIINVLKINMHLDKTFPIKTSQEKVSYNNI